MIQLEFIDTVQQDIRSIKEQPYRLASVQS